MTYAKNPKQEEIPGFRAARLWLDLSQIEASEEAGVCDRTYKMWELNGLTEFATTPQPGQEKAPIALISEAWGVKEDVLRAEAPAVDYRRLRKFCEANGGIETVFKALQFARRLEPQKRSLFRLTCERRRSTLSS